MKFTIRHWVIFWAQKHINMISTTSMPCQPSHASKTFRSFKIHEQQKNFFHLFPRKSILLFFTCWQKDMKKVFPPFRWMSEWMADVKRDPSRFKLHIQSYCCVCLELQMFIKPKRHFCASDAAFRGGKARQGWQKFIFYHNEFHCYSVVSFSPCCCFVRMRWNDNNGRITQIDELYRRSYSFHASIVLRVSFLRENIIFNFHRKFFATLSPSFLLFSESFRYEKGEKFFEAHWREVKRKYLR